MANDKKIDFVGYQLLALCGENNDLTKKAIAVLSELREINGKALKKRERVNYLYKVLHATRGFDTGLRTFLDCHEVVLTSSDTPSLGCYLVKLQNSAIKFNQLNPNVAKLIQSQIVDERNIFLHNSGRYPTEKECEKIVDRILMYFESIIALSKK